MTWTLGIDTSHHVAVGLARDGEPVASDVVADTRAHGEVLIQYTWPPQGTTYVSHHPPDPTNQRGGRGRKRP